MARLGTQLRLGSRAKGAKWSWRSVARRRTYRGRDASRFKAAFWSDVTPFETGIPATARAFRAGLSWKR
jgi:hypothetical protein